MRTPPEPAPVRDPSRRPRRLVWPLLWGASLAAAVGLVTYVGLTVSGLERELALRLSEAERLRAAVARQRQLVALLGAPDTRVVSLAGRSPSPAARGRIWWNPEGRVGFFVTSGLPPAPAGTTYQLWVISGGIPISGGVFDVSPQGHATLTVGPIPQAATVEVFAVTLEPVGGFPAPSGQMYLAGQTS